MPLALNIIINTNTKLSALQESRQAEQDEHNKESASHNLLLFVLLIYIPLIMKIPVGLNNS